MFSIFAHVDIFGLIVRVRVRLRVRFSFPLALSLTPALLGLLVPAHVAGEARCWRNDCHHLRNICKGRGLNSSHRNHLHCCRFGLTIKRVGLQHTFAQTHLYHWRSTRVWGIRTSPHFFSRNSSAATENAELDIARPSKLLGLTSRNWTMRHHMARVDIARPDNAAPDQT